MNFFLLSLLVLVCFVTHCLVFKRLVKVNLFLISFQPLFFILFVKFVIEVIENSKKLNFNLAGFCNAFVQLFSNYWYIVLTYFAIAPIFVFCVVNHFSRHERQERAIKYEPLGENVVSYVMTYIVPLTTLTVQSKFSNFIGNIILFIIIMILYIRLDLTYLNPVLILCGYKIYKVYTTNLEGQSYKEDRIRYVLSKKNSDEFERQFKKEATFLTLCSLGQDLEVQKG
ncbi:hypothetical protein GNF18_10250 [Ligilactobacillus pobuzihii]|uniref:hypothetical protein n=1 Tax=Ligilactobacillus pobuzihii TaxID=449659 RepID=UPI0019D0839B|nr:hypothetical protein [Ligilactobacillus pobuzihii]MBN7275521.1 hypothetical protein [Ligilactobacillus pobuzihii]